jgi:hypothetical protein
LTTCHFLQVSRSQHRGEISAIAPSQSFPMRWLASRLFSSFGRNEVFGRVLALCTQHIRLSPYSESGQANPYPGHGATRTSHAGAARLIRCIRTSAGRGIDRRSQQSADGITE